MLIELARTDGFRPAHSTRQCRVSCALEMLELINESYRLTGTSGP